MLSTGDNNLNVRRSYSSKIIRSVLLNSRMTLCIPKYHPFILQSANSHPFNRSYGKCILDVLLSLPHGLDVDVDVSVCVRVRFCIDQPLWRMKYITDPLQTHSIICFMYHTYLNRNTHSWMHVCECVFLWGLPCRDALTIHSTIFIYAVRMHPC